MAGEKYALPPLIRDAENHETQPGQVYDCPFGEHALRFLVVLDEAFADRNALARSKLPLKFRVELRLGEKDDRAIELLGREKYELIRAFLLGAKIPISAENKSDDRDYSLSLQLSSTFFVHCGNLNGENGDRLLNDICDDVARKIYARSEDFFADEHQGLTVWRLRTAQDLFGDVKPSPELFWPALPQEPAAFVPATAVAFEQDNVRPPRYAMAATILVGLLGVGAFSLNFFLHGQTRASAETARISTEIKLASLQPGDAVPINVHETAGSSAQPPPLPPVGSADAPADVPQAQVVPAVAAVSAPLEIQPASVHESIVPDDEAARQAAVLFAPMPLSGADAQPLSAPRPVRHSQPKPKPVLSAKAELLAKRRLARSLAKNNQDRSAKLKFPQNALASLAGVVKTIGQIPNQIFKGDKHVKS